MAAHTLSVRTYIIVLVLLTALTVLTIGVSLLPLEGRWHVAAGLSIAAVKAALVALFFMHVIASNRLTWAVIVIAILWPIIMVSLTFSDYLTRGQIPSMPGH